MGFSQSVFPFVHFDLIYLSDKHTGQIFHGSDSKRYATLL